MFFIDWLAPLFWSSDNLTGNQTYHPVKVDGIEFWSSDNLTGNQTIHAIIKRLNEFWSSDNLTGNQTADSQLSSLEVFWSSDNLTGNQTPRASDLSSRTIFKGDCSMEVGKKKPRRSGVD